MLICMLVSDSSLQNFRPLSLVYHCKHKSTLVKGVAIRITRCMHGYLISNSKQVKKKQLLRVSSRCGSVHADAKLADAKLSFFWFWEHQACSYTYHAGVQNPKYAMLSKTKYTFRVL